ncbi:MAG: hypothetical protein EA420_07975 [Candidatus Competibacteraceae bacterium]|nr:MAG: hypothetical protein EA420_07975 [Candidatus Competibacteraceae bacterium]
MGVLRRIRFYAALAWLAACALWLLAHHGLPGLLGGAVLAALVLAACRSGGADAECEREEVERFDPCPGPTLYQRRYDVFYKHLPGNIYHDRQ